MAKAKNYLIKGNDGVVAIATGKGQVKIVTEEKLITNLSSLLANRQAAGEKITEALKDAGFSVEAMSETDVIVVPPKK